MPKWKLKLRGTILVLLPFSQFSAVCWLACQGVSSSRLSWNVSCKCSCSGSPEEGMLPALFSQVGEICIPPCCNFRRGGCPTSSKARLKLSTTWDCLIVALALYAGLVVSLQVMNVHFLNGCIAHLLKWIPSPYLFDEGPVWNSLIKLKWFLKSSTFTWLLKQTITSSLFVEGWFLFFCPG